MAARTSALRDFFEHARTRADLPQMALQEANLALRDLGITDFVVESIVRDPPANRDIDTYTVKLASTSEADKTYSVSV